MMGWEIREIFVKLGESGWGNLFEKIFIAQNIDLYYILIMVGQRSPHASQGIILQRYINIYNISLINSIT